MILKILEPALPQSQMGLKARQHFPKEVARSGKDKDIVRSARRADSRSGEKTLDRGPDDPPGVRRGNHRLQLSVSRDRA